MYTISLAARRVGVAVATIRAWERRYRIVVPARTSSGYRLYDEAAIERLIAMRRLVASGWQPSVAAGAILAGRAPAAIDEGEPGSVSADVSAGGAAATDAGRRLVAAAASMDEGAVDAILDDVFARGSFERVATDVLFPALRALGDAWASDELTVASEHLASHAVLRRLSRAFDAAGHGDPVARPAIIGLPPGARHELGALAFAAAARRAGLSVAYLGPDLPVDDWLAAAQGAWAAVIGVVTRRDRRGAAEIVRRLRDARPDLLVALGGGAADDVAGPPAVLRLPDDLGAAVGVLATAARERANS
jgi:methanogenic corrinoid protein MtbC1